MRIRVLVLNVVLLWVPLLIHVQESADTLRSYHLFQPVPKSKMRKMTTDRPDVSESPITVDAGHFQYETDLIRLEKVKTHDGREQTILFNQANLKIGFTSSLALQVGFLSYGIQTQRDRRDPKEVKRGVGDVTIRLKKNFIGNDNGNFALAILPYVKLPTAQYTDDSKTEGGLIIPMLLKLPGEWEVGMQVEADRLADKEGNAMHTEVLQTLTVSHELMNHLDAIAETYYTYDFKKHQWTNYLNASVQLEIKKDIKLDAGLNYGLQSEAERNYFLGLSFRF